MFSALKKIVIIVLALLQLMAPLVHAHISDTPSGAGLHIPGLEIYSVVRDAPEIQALVHDAVCENQIIAIDSGIRLNLSDYDSDPIQGEAYISYQDALPKQPALLSHYINFSPHRYRLIPFAIVLSPQSPRAPPASV